MTRVILPLVVAITLGLLLASGVSAATPPPKPLTALNGVRLGDTKAQVRAKWGANYKPCPRSFCRNLTWLYIYPRGEPLGAAVRFGKAGRVVALFRLRSVVGYKAGRR
jgi:hypothetical protein